MYYVVQTKLQQVFTQVRARGSGVRCWLPELLAACAALVACAHLCVLA